MVRWMLNENFPAPSVTLMRASGHDVVSISESYAGIDDTEVLALAREGGRWLVTFDRDYGELIFAKKHIPPPAVILLRVQSYRPNEPAAWLERFALAPESLLGKFTVFSDNTVRSRPFCVESINRSSPWRIRPFLGTRANSWARKPTRPGSKWICVHWHCLNEINDLNEFSDLS